jgi:hypothetical protein
MNKILRHLGYRIVLNLALAASPVLAQTLPDTLNAPPAANAWAQPGMDEDTRRLVFLHREQTGVLNGASFGQRYAPPWLNGLDTQPVVSTVARGSPGDLGDARAADLRVN